MDIKIYDWYVVSNNHISYYYCYKHVSFAVYGYWAWGFSVLQKGFGTFCPIK